MGRGRQGVIRSGDVSRSGGIAQNTPMTVRPTLRAMCEDAASAAPGRVGTATLFLGCMFSGKTSQMLRRLADLPPASVAAFKHVIDDRYRPDAIVSHAGTAYPARPVRVAEEVLAGVSAGVEVVAIDEAHFFDAALPEVLAALCARGHEVLLTALSRDSWGRPFALVERLCTVAATQVLTATCAQCRQPAAFTQRLTPIVGGRMVGGAGMYEPRCATCWHPPPEAPVGTS